MKGKLRILGNMGLALFLACALMLAVVPATEVEAATAVEDVWVEFPTENHNAFNTEAEYRIHFTPTTPMSAWVDTITVWFPDGSTAMGPDDFDSVSTASTTASNYEVTAASCTVLGTGTTYYACKSVATVAGYRLKVTTPVDIPAATAAVLKIKAGASIETPSTAGNTYKVKVATSQDTTFVPCSDANRFSVDETLVTNFTNASTMPSSSVAGGGSAYGFTFQPAGSVTTSGWIKIQFPVGTYIPGTISTDYVKAGAVWATKADDPPASGVEVDTTARTIKVKPSEATGTEDTAYVFFAASAGIKNPEVIGTTATRDVFIWTSVDGQKVKKASFITLVAGSPTKLSFTSTSNSTISDDATIINAFSGALYLEVQDKFGNQKDPESSETVSLVTTGSGRLSAGHGDLTSFVDSVSCDGTTTLYYRNTVAEVDTITASVPTPAGVYDSVDWEMTVAPKVILKDASGNEIGKYGPSTTESVQTLGETYIQQAINAAFAGDTVVLSGTEPAPAIYEVASGVILNKADITIKSLNGAAYTTLAMRTGLTGDILLISATDVTIDDLTFKGLGKTTVLGARNAIDVRVGAFTISNNKFVNIYYDHILVSAQNDAITSGTITNNILTGLGRDAGRGGIWVESINAISGVSITNNTLSAFYGHDFPGILVAKTSGAVTEITIQGNIVSGSYYGIVLCGTVTALTGTKAIANNTITENIVGFTASDAAVEFDLVKNTITDSRLYGVHSTTAPTSATLRTIKYNDITGSGSWGIYNKYTTNASYVIAKYNYWGDATGPGLGTGTYASLTARGSGDNVSVGTTYEPWLHTKVTGTTPSVVADNASYQAVDTKLIVGWNTLSTPVQLIEAADAIDELIPSGMTIAYAYDGGWKQIDTENYPTGYVLNACDAVYVKMSAVTYVLLKFDAGAWTMPSKDLKAGWNLISLAYLGASKKGDLAVASVKLTAANLPGYSQVISPSMNANQTDMYGVSGLDWAFSSGETVSAQVMRPGLGYWIYMQNAATLAGFEITPIAPAFGL